MIDDLVIVLLAAGGPDLSTLIAEGGPLSIGIFQPSKGKSSPAGRWCAMGFETGKSFGMSESSTQMFMNIFSSV